MATIVLVGILPVEHAATGNAITAAQVEDVIDPVAAVPDLNPARSRFGAGSASLFMSARFGSRANGEVNAQRIASALSVTRFSSDTVIELYPLAPLLDSRFFTGAKNQFRQDLSRCRLTGSKRRAWFEGDAAYHLVGNAGDKEADAIEVSYVHGAYPDYDFANQEITSMRLIVGRTL